MTMHDRQQQNLGIVSGLLMQITTSATSIEQHFGFSK
jgi:hypothetical protein